MVTSSSGKSEAGSPKHTAEAFVDAAEKPGVENVQSVENHVLQNSIPSLTKVSAEDLSD